VTGLTTLLLNHIRQLLDLALGSKKCTELNSKISTVAQPWTGDGRRHEVAELMLTLFFASFFAFLSFEFLNSSIKRRS